MLRMYGDIQGSFGCMLLTTYHLTTYYLTTYHVQDSFESMSAIADWVADNAETNGYTWRYTHGGIHMTGLG